MIRSLPRAGPVRNCCEESFRSCPSMSDFGISEDRVPGFLILATHEMMISLFSILVFRSAVELSCLLVVAGFAKRLPVIRIPEELRITTMRLYVIDHCRLRVPAFLQALLTKWMCSQVHLPGFIPPGTVASGRCRPCFLRMHAFMLFTIFLPIWHKLRTAGMCAGVLWFVRQS